MKLPKDLEEVVKKIDWLETVKIVMPIVQPFVQGALWYGFTNLDKRAQALSRFIAVAEVIPAVDLNLPKGVVLASMYDGIEDALAIWNKLIQTLQEIPEQVKEIVEDFVEEVEEKIPKKEDILDPIRENDQVQAIGACIANAKKHLGWGVYTPVGYLWIVSCMAQKGFSVSSDWVKKEIAKL
jgi:hypothetical protein